MIFCRYKSQFAELVKEEWETGRAAHLREKKTNELNSVTNDICILQTFDYNMQLLLSFQLYFPGFVGCNLSTFNDKIFSRNLGYEEKMFLTLKM